VSEGAVKKEEKPRKFQAIRGTRDLLPPETALWNRVEQTAHEVFATFGFGEIRIPILQMTDLFARSIGVETDVVAKEMYTFVDEMQGLPDPANFAISPDEYVDAVQEAIKAGDIQVTNTNLRALARLKSQLEIFHERANTQSTEEAQLKFRIAASQIQFGDSISLGPEATASVCRAYIEHNMQQSPQPVKLYYMGPMFRRERPQKGRYRQFYQIGAEVLEAIRSDAAKDAPKDLAKDAAIDAEVIEMLMTFFDRVGLTGTELSINSIGHSATIAAVAMSKNSGPSLLRSKTSSGRTASGASKRIRCGCSIPNSKASRALSPRCRASPITFATIAELTTQP